MANKGQFKKGSSGNKTGKAKPFNKDGWENALSGIGSAMHDKRSGTMFCPVDLSYEQCIQICESDDLGKKAAEAPVKDAFRQGWELSIGDEGDYDGLKDDVENRMRELKVNQVIQKALIQKRALGGGAILVGVKDNKTMDRALDLSKATKIDFLTNLEPMDLVPNAWYTNPLDEKFGEVKLWELRSFGNMGAVNNYTVKTAASKQQTKTVLIHESRLIIFNADKVSKYTTTQNPAGDFWGLSIYTQIYEILRDFNISWSAAGLLITDFSQATFGIENLMQLVAREPDKLRARMQAMEMGRSVARAILIDTKETFERKTTPLNGLPDLLVQLSRRFAASIDIPLSVLMSGGAKTDDAAMGDELRYYYDRLDSVRDEEVTPTLRLFAGIIMRGLRQRKLPKRWHIRWRPLWQLTDEQKANARLAQARVDAIYIDKGVLDPQVVADLRMKGEYSYETPLPENYTSPGFMALPPLGVLVDGMDPNTGLPPGEQPPKPDGTPGGPSRSSSVAIKPHARNKPRRTNAAKSPDTTAGGATAGRGQAARDEEHEECTTCPAEHASVGEMAACSHCLNCDDCGYRAATNITKVSK